MVLAPHTKLGPYEIVSSLGAGGMGEVYRARDETLDREVAIKVLPKELASDPDRLRRFEQEARAAAALNHPNILAVESHPCAKGRARMGHPAYASALSRTHFFKLTCPDTSPQRERFQIGREAHL
jgi:serine/threonine protein kinase